MFGKVSLAFRQILENLRKVVENLRKIATNVIMCIVNISYKKKISYALEDTKFILSIFQHPMTNFAFAWPYNILSVLSFPNGLRSFILTKPRWLIIDVNPWMKSQASAKDAFCKYKDNKKMNKVDTRIQVNTWTLWGAADSSIVNITDRSNHCWTNIWFQIGSRKVKFTSCVFPCLAFEVNPFVYGKFDR